MTVSSLLVPQILRAVRKLYAHHDADKINNLNEKHQVLERHELRKRTQEVDSPSGLTYIKQIKLVKNLPEEKPPGPGNFTGKFYETYKEETIENLHDTF